MSSTPLDPTHPFPFTRPSPSSLLFSEELELHFLCAYDFQPAEPPLFIANPASFLRDAGPALVLSLCAIEAALHSGWLSQTDSKLCSVVPVKEGGTLLEGKRFTPHPPTPHYHHQYLSAPQESLTFTLS